MSRLLTLVLALLIFARPAAAQSCDVDSDTFVRDIRAVLDDNTVTEEDIARQQAWDARRAQSTVDAIRFELETAFDLIDVGHAKTVMVIGEVVQGELEMLRDLCGLDEQAWAHLLELHGALFDEKGTLQSPEKTRKAAEVLLDAAQAWADEMPGADS
jgi:hypothetical protein